MSIEKAVILVVGDEQENGELVVELLSSRFADVHLSCNPAAHADDLTNLRPAVLVLVFSELQASQEFLRTARSDNAAFCTSLCSSIVLCKNIDVPTAFELCRQRCFDDYVPFWPVTHDGSRLPMAVMQALRMHAAMPNPVLEREAQAAAGAMPELIHSRPHAAHGAAMSAIADAARSDQQPASDDQQPAGRRSEPHTILFVDDDPEQHSILGLMLAGTQLNPVFAGTAGRALQMLDRLLPGLVMVDVNLPDGGGMDLIRTIKSDAALSDLPVVTVTGIRTREVVLGSLAAGAVDFIAKPYSKPMLMAKLERAMAKSGPA